MKAIKSIYNGIDKFNDFLGRIYSVLSLARSSCAVSSTGRRSGPRT